VLHLWVPKGRDHLMTFGHFPDEDIDKIVKLIGPSNGKPAGVIPCPHCGWDMYPGPDGTLLHTGSRSTECKDW
jgi:hypothetical protein